MRIAQAFANRVAVAIELSERVGRKAVQSLLEGQELERKRLARELHDETGQALASILLGLKSLEEQVGTEPVARIRELVGAPSTTSAGSRWSSAARARRLRPRGGARAAHEPGRGAQRDRHPAERPLARLAPGRPGDGVSTASSRRR